MHLLYYDEVKYDPPKQTSFWLGGICVPHTSVAEIEAEVNAISEKAFGSALLSKDTEFHGIELCRGSGLFKGRDFDERLEILGQLLAVISRNDVDRLRIKVNPMNIRYSSDQPADIAFMFLVEKANELLKVKDSVGMMFGDYDEPAIGSSVATLSEFRKGGTRWAGAKEIDRLIDTVHFAKSHHSRMIQLADVFLYCSQFMWGNNSSGWRKRVADVIRPTKLLWVTKVKDWPGEPVWYR